MKALSGGGRLLVAATLAVVLAGCSSLFRGPPPDLYRVTPKSTYPNNLPHIRAQLLIETPVALAGLDTARIALSRSPVSIDYFADSEWTDRVPRLIQTALIESFENSGAITAIGREAIDLHADFVLNTEVRHFEADYRTPNGPPLVWATLNVRLVKEPAGTIIAQASFSRRVPAAANTMPSIVDAFDDALGSVMKRIVVWTVTNPSVSQALTLSKRAR